MLIDSESQKQCLTRKYAHSRWLVRHSQMCNLPKKFKWSAFFWLQGYFQDLLPRGFQVPKRLTRNFGLIPVCKLLFPVALNAGTGGTFYQDFFADQRKGSATLIIGKNGRRPFSATKEHVLFPLLVYHPIQYYFLSPIGGCSRMVLILSLLNSPCGRLIFRR